MRSPDERAPRPARPRLLGLEPLEPRCLLSRMAAPPMPGTGPGGPPVEGSTAWGWSPGGDGRSGFALRGSPYSDGAPYSQVPAWDGHHGPMDSPQGGWLPWGGGPWDEVAWTDNAPPPANAGPMLHPDLHPMDSALAQPGDPGGTIFALATIQTVLTVPDDHPYSSVIVPAVHAVGVETPSLVVSVGPAVHESLPVSALAGVVIQVPQAMGVVLAAAPWPAAPGAASGPGVAAGVGSLARSSLPVPTAWDPRGGAAPEVRGWISGMASPSPWELTDRGLTNAAAYGSGWLSAELALAAPAPQRLVIPANPDDPAADVAERMFRLPMPDPQSDGLLTHFALPGRATLEAAIDRFLGHVDPSSPGRGEPGEPDRWVPASLALMAVVLASDAIQRFAHRSPDDDEQEHEPRGAGGDGDASLARFPGLPGPWSPDET